MAKSWFKGMKFKKFEFACYINSWFLIPTIRFIFNDFLYYPCNFAIQVHFLCWGMRWFWLEKEQK